MWFAAFLGTLLTVLELAFSDRAPELAWVSLANRTMSIYAIWTVAVLGQWQRRTSRKQNRAERIAVLALALERGAPARNLQELNTLLSDLRNAIAQCVDYLRDAVH